MNINHTSWNLENYCKRVPKPEKIERTYLKFYVDFFGTKIVIDQLFHLVMSYALRLF